MKKYFAKLIRQFNGVVYANHKLFLCSRNIQVGDKVFTNDEFWPQNTEIVWEQKNEEMNEPYKEKTFKVIGDISPDALSFVKEEDEFDEDEIKEGYFIGGHLCYKIKGPCGHFH